MLAVPQGVKRTDFLENARTKAADFYISGYVTPVGEAAAVVEQVVSVESGVILFSQTAQVQSVADVASQSLQARAQILAFVNRATQNIAPQSTNTPAPTSSNGANMQLRGSAASSTRYFTAKAPRRRRRLRRSNRSAGLSSRPSAGPGPPPAPTSPTPPTNSSLRCSGTTRAAHQNVRNVATAADAICGTQRNNTIAAGTLSETFPHHGRPEVVFTLSVYTCFGAVLDKAVGKGDSFKQAVDAAVATYATAHPTND